MRKHDEGYALPFVLVVLLVMCALAIAVMDFSTRNLKAQQTTIWRMQDKYAATGEIEKIYAVMHNSTGSTVAFPGSEKLHFAVTDGNAVLRIAAFSKRDEENAGVWVIAAIEADNLPDPNTLVQADGKQKLSVTHSSDAKYLWYEVVTQETAEDFLSCTYLAQLKPQEGTS